MNHENLNTWNLIYSHFDPVALHIFGLSLHWYGIAYVSALLITFYMAKYFVTKNKNQFISILNTHHGLFITEPSLSDNSIVFHSMSNIESIQIQCIQIVTAIR